jgi:hypothetical protein
MLDLVPNDAGSDQMFLLECWRCTLFILCTLFMQCFRSICIGDMYVIPVDGRHHFQVLLRSLNCHNG